MAKLIISARIQGSKVYLAKKGHNYLSPLKTIVFTSNPKFFLELPANKHGKRAAKKTVSKVKSKITMDKFRVERKRKVRKKRGKR